MATKITLRRAKISGGRESLYLDYYPAVRNPETMKLTRKETLGIYIFQNPKTQLEKDYNKETLYKAEIIRCIRLNALINEEYGFLDKGKQKEDFLEYFRTKAMKKYDKWMIVYQHFKNFVGGSCTFGDLTIELCQKFRDYLLNAKQLKHTYKKVKRNSAAGYFSTFRALLKMAYKEKWLRENLNDHLESIEWEDVRKEFLTKKELDILVKTPCDIPVLKSASLFSCLTGLRISDILNLKWENIMVGADNVYYMRIRTEKTATEATLPIRRDALSLFGERSTGKVFKGLERSMIQHPLKKWITQAGITKHITFHCFRHTYATLQLAYGTDIYTVSKMLTHKNVQTTQIYANIIDAKKWEAANRITLKIE